MSISIGDKIPSVSTKVMGADGLEDFNIADHIAGKKVVLFAVPGAFTPSCNDDHLPGYVMSSDKIKAAGIADIICTSVNDPFVMKAWGASLNTDGNVTMVADGNGEFAAAMGMTFDAAGAGLATRSKRYSMIVNDGVVEALNVEDVPSDVKASSAENLLSQL